MQELFGQCNDGFLILHGGAGPQDPSTGRVRKVTEELIEIARQAAPLLAEESREMDAVVMCLGAMERSESFNAGYGSALQADGQIRMSAALMSGTDQTFSGVISASHLVHPSLLAKHLQNESSRVLTSPGTELLARQLHLPVESPLSPARVKTWREKAETNRSLCDTVGCVVRSCAQRLAVGTSTGGRGFEFPGRVSDSATVAGTYASTHAAISCTGIGEEIVDDATAARLETRCRDGMTLESASRRCCQEALAHKRHYGWIALDRAGHWTASTLTACMTFAVVDQKGNVLASSLPPS